MEKNEFIENIIEKILLNYDSFYSKMIILKWKMHLSKLGLDKCTHRKTEFSCENIIEKNFNYWRQWDWF